MNSFVMSIALHDRHGPDRVSVDNLREVAKEAIHIADVNQCRIHFLYDGVNLEVTSRSEVEYIMRNYIDGLRDMRDL